MSLDVISALELDKADLSGKFLLIKEHSGSEATFVISCLLAKELNERKKVCLVLTHGDISHYQNVGLKLRYNLRQNIEQGLVTLIDFTAILKEEPIFSANENFLKNIYLNIKEIISEGTTIMFDGLSHLLDLGYDIRMLNLFVQNLKILILDAPKCGLVINTHVSSEESTDLMLSNILDHISDTVCEISPLVTGISSHVSGHIHFLKNGPLLEGIEKRYHFKLLDRGVKVFSPGV